MVRPRCVCFFPFPTLSTALASNQTEADGGGLHRYGGESTFLPSTVTHARRYYSGINQYLAGGLGGGAGSSGEDVLAAVRRSAPRRLRARGEGWRETSMTLQW